MCNNQLGHICRCFRNIYAERMCLVIPTFLTWLKPLGPTVLAVTGGRSGGHQLAPCRTSVLQSTSTCLWSEGAPRSSVSHADAVCSNSNVWVDPMFHWPKFQEDFTALLFDSKGIVILCTRFEVFLLLYSDDMTKRFIVKKRIGEGVERLESWGRGRMEQKIYSECQKSIRKKLFALFSERMVQIRFCIGAEIPGFHHLILSWFSGETFDFVLNHANRQVLSLTKLCLSHNRDTALWHGLLTTELWGPASEERSAWVTPWDYKLILSWFLLWALRHFEAGPQSRVVNKPFTKDASLLRSCGTWCLTACA